MDTTTGPTPRKRQFPAEQATPVTAGLPLIGRYQLMAFRCLQKEINSLKEIINRAKETKFLNEHMDSMTATVKEAVDTVKQAEKTEINRIQELTAENMDLRESNSGLLSENEMLKNRIVELQQKEADFTAKLATRQSFAEVTRSQAAGPTGWTVQKPLRPQRATLVQMPGKTTKEVETIVRESLKQCPKECRPSVTIAGQNVKVVCTTEGKLGEAKLAMAGTGLETFDRVMLKPQVKIMGIIDFNEATFVNEINEDNEGILGDSKVAITIPTREQDKVDVVLEVTGQVQRELLEAGHVYYNYTNCRVVEHLRLRQCLRCLALGHKKENCKCCENCLKPGCQPNCKKRPEKRCFKCGGQSPQKGLPSSGSSMQCLSSPRPSH